MSSANGVVQPADLTLLPGPGPSDGTFVSAIGCGRHFDPLWWGEASGGSARVPSAALAGLSGLSLVPFPQMDAGPAAAVTWCLPGAESTLAPRPTGEWPDFLTDDVMAGWSRALAIAAAQHGVSCPGADDTVLVLMCAYPLDVLAPEAVGVQGLIDDVSQTPRASPLDQVQWAIVADHSQLWLIHKTPAVAWPAFLLAAAGRRGF